MNLGNGNKAAQFHFFGIHKSDFRYSAEAVMVRTIVQMTLPPRPAEFTISTLPKILGTDGLHTVLSKS